MSTTPEEHSAKVVPVRRGHETNAFEVRCSCGWRSRYCDSDAEAETVSAQHTAKPPRTLESDISEDRF